MCLPRGVRGSCVVNPFTGAVDLRFEAVSAKAVSPPLAPRSSAPTAASPAASAISKGGEGGEGRLMATPFEVPLAVPVFFSGPMDPTIPIANGQFTFEQPTPVQEQFAPGGGAFSFKRCQFPHLRPFRASPDPPHNAVSNPSS